MTGLAHAWSLPAEVAGFDVEARWQPAQRVGVTVHYLDREGRVLQRYTARVGSHLWHECWLPALRAHSAQNGLTCTVREIAARPTAQKMRA
jgi:hypothetical protein